MNGVNKIAKDWRYLTLIGTVVGGIVIFGNRYYPLPEKVEAIEVKNEIQDGEIGTNNTAVTQLAQTIQDYMKFQNSLEKEKEKRERLLQKYIDETRKANGR